LIANMTTATAPGKVIVFGEHAVVYGEPALGVPLSRSATVTLSPGRGRISLVIADGIVVARAEGAASPNALVEAALGELAREVDVHIALDFPPMAGFGSSAALAVALLRAKDRHLSGARLLREAIRVENVAHGKASGVDPAIAIAAAPILFERSGDRPRIRRVRFSRAIHLIVGTSGGHGGARHAIGGVAELRERAPRLVRAAMTALGETTRTGTAALAKGDLEIAGKTMDLAHGVLSGLGIVAPEVEQAILAARAGGALGAKMSGAGGAGGAFIALAADEADARRIVRVLTIGPRIAWIETIGAGPA
jgi:mevalonate kinase